MSQELIQAVAVLTKEKGFAPELIFTSLEDALVQAYKKEERANPEARVEINRKTGAFTVFAKKTVVDQVEDPELEISLEEAQKIHKNYEVGDTVEIDVTPKNFGRSAAQAAKQMLIQSLKEAERSVVYDEFSERAGDIVTGIITRVDGRNVFIDLG
ncbi:MAG: transcription termination/antitermination protein NusA, partial [Veillonella sp.]|nr:transcription termination/antitermination protein NusA [Veillonella sp.]